MPHDRPPEERRAERDTARSPRTAAVESDPTGGRRHAGHGPPEFWRSFEELEQSPEFLARLEREFPALADQWHAGIDRRRFLELMGASLALAGVTGCQDEPGRGEIVPYVETPEELVPGVPLAFATAMTLGGYALGLLVESHMGRPTKVEGNPDHPASLGSTDVFAQAAVLSLYDPDRAQSVRRLGQINTREQFLDELAARMSIQRNRDGAGLRLLTGTVTSPTLAAQITALLEQFPAARWHQYEPVSRDHARAGAIAAFGEDLETIYDLEQADVILALDDDFLGTGPAHVRYARDFARRRAAARGGENGEPQQPMNRLYVVEATVSLTGSNADHRLPVRPPGVEAVARLVAAELGIDVDPPPAADRESIPDEWIRALVSDLRGETRGADSSGSLVTAGPAQPPLVHALAHAINAELGSSGRAVAYIPPVPVNPTSSVDSLNELADAMRRGDVQTLVILGGNPAFTAPADLEFGGLLRDVPFTVHLSESVDETALLCRWYVPQVHFLESWSDARAFDGTATILQPLIAPLYGGLTDHELVALLGGEQGRDPQAIVREFWETQFNGDDAEARWLKALHDGVVQGTAFERQTPALMPDWAERVPAPAGAGGGDREGSTGEGAFFVSFRPDPRLWDGRFSNNAWLHELPRPLSHVVWDNPAYVSAADARRLNLENGRMVELSHGEQRLRVPVWILPGHPEGVVTVYFGPGRAEAGRVGSGVGFDGYRLRTTGNAWSLGGVTLRPTDATHPLVTTQEHQLMHGRDLVRTGTAAELAAHPDHPPFMHAGHGPPPAVSLYPEMRYDGYQWGMAIDQSACIGCQACVIACQAENNIPVVGKEQVAMNREMYWLRVDTYYRGPAENPETYHQPVPCMHCEQAPCEPVCPVAATTHSTEGLNEMTYNRCFGTRYCSNNCPYKVRRFNYLSWHKDDPVQLQMLWNPDVTVRSRGVMEKCTYCVQRINSVRITAEREQRPIEAGEIMTACQQACPARAITFGNINNPDEEVSAWKATPLNYALLANLNTRPRTTYLAAIRNPHPELGAAHSHEDAH